MPKPVHTDIEDARVIFGALLRAAQKGRVSIITRRGRPIGGIVPVGYLPGRRQKSLNALAGTGKGLWGRDSTRALRRLRDEWNR